MEARYYKNVLFKKENESFNFEQTILYQNGLSFDLTNATINADIVDQNNNRKPLDASIINTDTINIQCAGLTKGIYYTDIKITTNAITTYTDIVAIIVKPSITL